MHFGDVSFVTKFCLLSYKNLYSFKNLTLWVVYLPGDNFYSIFCHDLFIVCCNLFNRVCWCFLLFFQDGPVLIFIVLVKCSNVKTQPVEGDHYKYFSPQTFGKFISSVASGLYYHFFIESKHIIIYPQTQGLQFSANCYMPRIYTLGNHFRLL